MLERFPYRLRLRRPLRLRGGVLLGIREGVLFRDPGSGGLGDAAPLPGFSQESLAEVLHGDPADPSLPSLVFAAECARQGRLPPVSAAMNALWIAAEESPASLARRLAAWRNPVVKVKPEAEPRPARWLEFLRLRPDARLRVDANRAWTLEQTLRIWRALPAGALHYLEEPLRDPDDYPALWARAPVPIALDESLRQPEGRPLAEAGAFVRALVLKPTLLGGESAWRPWADLARRRGMDLIWSSCFESGVGLWHLASLSRGGAAAGLDTVRWLAEDLLHPRPRPRAGFLVCGPGPLPAPSPPS